ncbi:hypothetical protein BS47DRAFT_1382503 [Hydnum rufescens UP504]|uniref:DUF6534 domain-containing protein n=1 Tax=Hydnum rufescens UP504 TaxID=1448309 RepID=A0A9P6AWQ3_9AGAM|nr:hypothetical protein BS47DRAFT_1382503 [Hydnum rufescens UP504]
MAVDVTRVNVFGGSFFGNLLTALCFGVLTVQTSSYYHAFPNDRRPVKLVVAFLWTLQAFQLVCVTWSLYWWLVINYRNPLVLGWATWEFSTYQITTVFASATVQTFFAHRVYSLSANLYVGVLVLVLVLLKLGLGVATSIKVKTNLEFQAVLKDCKWLVVSWFTIQTTADIMITTCMCLLLRRRRTGFQKTDSVINRMVLYTISTGLITSVLSVFLPVVFATYGFHVSGLAIALPLPTLYPITMLANLHMRTSLRARLDTPTPLELISYSIKKRMRRNAADHRSEERPRATRMNISPEAICDDVNMQPMFNDPLSIVVTCQNRDTNVRFAVVQGPVLGGT